MFTRRAGPIYNLNQYWSETVKSRTSIGPRTHVLGPILYCTGPDSHVPDQTVNDRPDSQ